DGDREPRTAEAHTRSAHVVHDREPPALVLASLAQPVADALRFALFDFLPHRLALRGSGRLLRRASGRVLRHHVPPETGGSTAISSSAPTAASSGADSPLTQTRHVLSTLANSGPS